MSDHDVSPVPSGSELGGHGEKALLSWAAGPGGEGQRCLCSCGPRRASQNRAGFLPAASRHGVRRGMASVLRVLFGTPAATFNPLQTEASTFPQEHPSVCQTHPSEGHIPC